MTQLKERSFEEPDELITEVKSLFEKAYQKNFTFLLVGRGGVGKSSTINTLLGQKVADVGKFIPVTKKVKKYESNIDGIPYTVVDTPGLADASEKDEVHINSIKKAVPKPDSLWFVTALGEQRVRKDEMKTIETISSAFGEEGWKKAVIVFTYADKVDLNEYEESLATRTKLIQEEIAKHINVDIAQEIPSVAVANNPDPLSSIPLRTPDKELWLDKLYTIVIKRISDNGLFPITMATAPRIISKDASNQNKLSNPKTQPILLDERQKPQIRKRIETSADFGNIMRLATSEITKAETASTDVSESGIIEPTKFLTTRNFFTWLWGINSYSKNGNITNEDISIKNLDSYIETKKLNDLYSMMHDFNTKQHENDWSFDICSNFLEISKTFKAASNIESFIELNIEKAEPIVINFDLTLSPDEREDSLPYIVIMGFYPSKALHSLSTNLSLIKGSLQVVIEDILFLLDPDEKEKPVENIPSFSAQVILFAVNCKENL